MKPMTPFGRRRFRPWAFEFQGARHYPWGSVEQRVAEENAARQAIESDDCPQEENPPTVDERASLLPPISRVYTSESKSSWDGGKTNNEGKPVFHPHNAYSAGSAARSNGMQFSRHLYTGDYAVAHSANNGVAEPIPDNPRYAEYYSHNRHPPFNQPLPSDTSRVQGVYDPLTFETIPLTPRQSSQEILISRSARYQPGSERPRFDRPYMNFTNAMWMPYPPQQLPA